MRESYLSVATRGAVLYFVLSDLAHINYMYQFSLEWFQKKFVDSIDYVNKRKLLSQSQPSIPTTQKVHIQSRHKSVSAIESRKDTGNETEFFNQHLNNIIDELTSYVYKVPIFKYTSRNHFLLLFIIRMATFSVGGRESALNHLHAAFLPTEGWTKSTPSWEGTTVPQSHLGIISD